MTTIRSYNSYQFGSESALNTQQMRQMVSCFEIPDLPSQDALEGRAAVSGIELKNIGRVVVRSYSRGGVIRHFNKKTYLKLCAYRCQSEFDLLLHLEKLGVSVPHPVAFAYQSILGAFFYRAWLVTKEISNACTLAHLSVTAPARAQMVMDQLSRQIAILIENHIHHVDLHPGNVLVDSENQVFIIDFDKARTNRKNHLRLRKKYVERWQRSVLKHQLPDILNIIKIP
jgi:3-deoxy-D-manno-octulosonic acid kinase